VRASFGRPDLVVSDLDGTLVSATLEFSAAITNGVARLRQAGVPFVICTGRMLRSASRMAAQLGIDSGLIVCYQGALVVDLGSGEWLLHRPVLPHLAAEVVVHMRTIGRHLNAYIDDEFFVEDMDEWARRYADYAKVACNVVDDLRATVQATPPTKLLVATDPVRGGGAAAPDSGTVARQVVCDALAATVHRDHRRQCYQERRPRVS
jgi:hydroxymethylpyrimidine pyrophosphatase-like HAD family hydrolase